VEEPDLRGPVHRPVVAELVEEAPLVEPRLDLREVGAVLGAQVARGQKPRNLTAQDR
jgi:hypothetical protein